MNRADFLLFIDPGARRRVNKSQPVLRFEAMRTLWNECKYFYFRTGARALRWLTQQHPDNMHLNLLNSS